MKIQNNASYGQVDTLVIIGNKENVPGHLTDQEARAFEKFVQGEKNVAEWTDFETTKIFVKLNDDAEKMRVAGSEARKLMNKSIKRVGVKSVGSQTASLLEGFLLTNYQFLKYFKDKDDRVNQLEEIVTDTSVTDDQVSELLNTYEAVSWARDMVNEPVSFLNAEQFASEIGALSEKADFNVTVLEKTQIESLKMGGLLAVNQGSVDGPTFTIVEYKPENAKNSQPIALVGKGVVYDTGGLSLKPTPNSMDVMKSDMGGGACVAGAIYLAALQKLPLHIIALIPATDNRPGLNAYAPGDVVTMFNGSTVEVLNTDAEGRMILADALAYSSKYNPELVIDAATLTGAAVRAIGDHASIVMGNADDRYFEQMEVAGKEKFERVVRFPFWDEYFEEMKSPIADLKNLGGPTAGMITAGKFLEHFVEAPYIHIDLAGPSWRNKAVAYHPQGGSGVGVRLLYQFLKNYA